MQPRDRHTWKIEDRKISTTPANRVGGFKTRQPFCKMKTALAQPEYQRWIKSSRRFNYDKSVLWFFVSASSTLITRCINPWPTVSFHNYVSYDIKSLKEKKKKKKEFEKSDGMAMVTQALNRFHFNPVSRERERVKRIIRNELNNN